MSRFRKAWQSLNFYKEYLFGFETLVFATLGILSMLSACNTPKRKENLKSHHMTPLNSLFCASHGPVLRLYYPGVCVCCFSDMDFSLRGLLKTVYRYSLRNHALLLHQTLTEDRTYKK